MANPSMVNISRIHPLENRIFAANTVLIKPSPALTRISLRAGADEIASINQVLGIDLPVVPKTLSSKNKRTALWIGPDEWLIIDEAESELNQIPNLLDDILCSAVDISHRNTAIIVNGARAATVLNSGCPQNLGIEEFPSGSCSRTILGKSEIILWRISCDEFHVECWRSFSDYVWKFLVDAAKTV